MSYARQVRSETIEVRLNGLYKEEPLLKVPFIRDQTRYFAELHITSCQRAPVRVRITEAKYEEYVSIRHDNDQFGNEQRYIRVPVYHDGRTEFLDFSTIEGRLVHIFDENPDYWDKSGNGEEKKQERAALDRRKRQRRIKSSQLTAR